MRPTRRLLSVGAIIAVVMGTLVPAAGASSGWELVEVLPDDGTWCEFEPGSETEYSVDPSTLPRFGRWRIVARERPDGSTRVNVQVQPAPEDPGPVRYLKDDRAAPGPDVILTTFRAHQIVVISADGETEQVTGTFTHVTTTPDGQFVDRSQGRWSGFDGDDPIVVRETGICRA